MSTGRLSILWAAIVCLVAAAGATAQEPVMLIDLGTSSSLSNLTGISGNLICRGGTSATGPEVLFSDGTPEGTVLIEIYPGSSGSSPIWFADLEGIALFRAWGTNSDQGYELWRSDGTVAGTWLVRDINPDWHSLPTGLVTYAGKVYFNAVRFDGQELWVSDGSEPGTYQLKDINPSGDGGPAKLTVAGDRLFFTASDGVHGNELWLTDGTEGGTVMVKDIHPTLSSNPAYLTAVGEVLFFAADDGVHGQELWRSDGTADGTYMVKDIRPGISPSQIISPVAHDGLLFFGANDGVNDLELWRSDGTAEGTWMVKNINPSGSSWIVNLASAGGLVYFSAGTIWTGRELWRSDGTEAGTFMVKDICPGSTGSGPYGIVGFDGQVYFFADDGVHGQEPWVSDGTADGTRILGDFVPGSGHAAQGAEYVVSGGRLFFNLRGLDAESKVCLRLWVLEATSTGAGPEPSPPAHALLVRNHPNPFNPHTTIVYTLPAAERVDLRIFDASGRLVRVLESDAERAQGRHEAVWDGRDDRGRQVATGTYFCRLRTASGEHSGKLVLIR